MDTMGDAVQHLDGVAPIHAEVQIKEHRSVQVAQRREPGAAWALVPQALKRPVEAAPAAAAGAEHLIGRVVGRAGCCSGAGSCGVLCATDRSHGGSGRSDPCRSKRQHQPLCYTLLGMYALQMCSGSNKCGQVLWDQYWHGPLAPIRRRLEATAPASLAPETFFDTMANPILAKGSKIKKTRRGGMEKARPAIPETFDESWK